MMLVSVLVPLLLITAVKSHPVSYSTYDEREFVRDHPILVLVDHQIPDMEDEMFDSGNDPGSTVIRTKRVGQLSISDSLNALRQKVLNNLFRRKQLQDQRQIEINQRILETVGKRSLPLYNEGLFKARNRNGIEYVIKQEEKLHDRNATPERIPGRVQDWFQTNNSVFRERQDDPTQRVQANELRLL